MNGILQQNRSKSELNARDVRDAVKIGLKRSKLTLRLAQRLKTIADASGSEKARYNAAKLAYCGTLGNIYTGKDMHNSDGECFDGVGNLWACSLPYCANCQARTAGRHRRRIRETLACLSQRDDLTWQFPTLTSPSVPASLLLCIEVNLTAWALLRKRKLFVESVRAGYRGIEFTVNNSTGLLHPHQHLLVMSKFLRPSDVRAEWQNAITVAWQKEGVSLNFPASGAVIKIIHELIAKNGGSLENAILETAKYCADGATWAALSDSDLLDVASLDRFPRLFETFGQARNNPFLNTVHNHNLSDGEPTRKRRKINEGLRDLSETVSNQQDYRKTQLAKRFPFAEFETLDGRKFASQKATGTLTTKTFTLPNSKLIGDQNDSYRIATR